MDKDYIIRIKEARNKKGLTQTELANKVGIKQQTLSGYENGKMNPPTDVTRRIAKICDVSLDWLCELDENKNEFNIKTYSDVFRFFLALDRDHGHIIENTHKEHFPGVVFDDTNISIFLTDWRKMKTVLLQGVIDEDIYNLWVEKTLLKYDISIEENPLPDDWPV